ncbi:unnamed protein product [Amoebophrya sp. A25]|nr:unnamed protein product [Amoebophrya sp. A25]|eukprot:GSA25T00014578001.1
MTTPEEYSTSSSASRARRTLDNMMEPSDMSSSSSASTASHSSSRRGSKRFAQSALLLSASCLLAHGQRHAQNEQRLSVDMVAHSFMGSIDTSRLDNTRGATADWFVNGAASATLPSQVMLTPDVQNRFGYLWAREPIDSRDFEVLVDYKIQGEMMRGQGFAFYYVQEDFPSWFDSIKFYAPYVKGSGGEFDSLLNNQGLTFYAWKEQMRGMGVLFSEHNHVTQVQCFQDDMQGIRRNLSPPKFLRYDNKEITLHVSRRPSADQSRSMMTVQVKIGEKWNHVCETGTGGVNTGSGYMGFTSFTGKAQEPGEQSIRPAVVGITKITATNHDEHHLGSRKDMANEDYMKDYEALMAEDHNYMNTTDQTAALDRLEKLLERFAATHKDQKLLSQLGELGDRTSNLENVVRNFRQEVRIVLGRKKGTGGLSDLRSHMHGLRTLLKHSGQEHEEQVERARTKAMKALSTLSAAPEHAKVMSEFEESLQKLQQGSSSLVYMFGFIIVCIAAVTGLIWNKMRSYEKKHFL